MQIQIYQNPKPKTPLGSILTRLPPTNTEASKPTEKALINPVSVIASAKKKHNEVSKALDEKAKVLKEQEKLKKEEKLKEEIIKKQALSITITPASSKKSGEETSKKVEKKEEKDEKEKEKKKEEEEDEESRNEIEETNEKEKQEPYSIVDDKKEKKLKIEKIYFKVFEDDEKAQDIRNRYAYEYLFSYRNWKISCETKLVRELMTGNFKNLKETVEEVSASRAQGRGGNENKGIFGKIGTKFGEEQIQPNISNENTTFQRSKTEFKQPEPKETPSTETGEGLGKSGRKDLSNEEKLASEFKVKREEQFAKDPIRFKLTEYFSLFIFFLEK
jgi:hypothetical protein